MGVGQYWFIDRSTHNHFRISKEKANLKFVMQLLSLLSDFAPAVGYESLFLYNIITITIIPLDKSLV